MMRQCRAIGPASGAFRQPLPEVPDPEAKRYQLTEILPIRRHATECQRHAGQCLCRKHTARAACDEAKTPPLPFGSRVIAIPASVTGTYRLR